MTTDTGTTEPIGMAPKHVWLWQVREDRLWAIFSAMKRYAEAAKPIPTEWLSEFEEHWDSIKSAGRSSSTGPEFCTVDM